MKKLFELVTNIEISIDRIYTSIPRNYKDKLYQLIDYYGHKKYSKRYKKSLYHGFDIDGCRVILNYPLKPKHIDPSRNKCYIRLLQPTTECQDQIKDIFNFVVGKRCDRNGVLIKQVEVAYDIYTHNEHDYSYIEKFLDHHCVLRYGKRGSYKRFLKTKYMGCNGNVHKGTIGVRRYNKTINGKDFYRFEVQLNRRYLKNNNITFHSFPLDPKSFNVLQHIELFDNFSIKGIKNLSRRILKEEGLKNGKDKYYHDNLENMKKQVKETVIGGSSGPKKRISNQLDALNTLLKEKELSPHYKKYFESMSLAKQLIYCLSDICITEDNISKRMYFCQA